MNEDDENNALFNWAESDAAKREGMDRVERGANEEWLEAMYGYTVMVARQQAYLTSDDVWRYANEVGYRGKTRDNRAFGPVMSRAVKDGVCEKADVPGRNSERVSLHRSPRQVWRSLILQDAQNGEQMIEIDQERLGKDSASSAYRRRRCAGSSNLVNALREANSLPAIEPDANARSGTIVHLAWCGRYSGTLTREQTETLNTLTRLERLVATDWAGNDECTMLGREVRLWLHDGLEPIHSGQFDVAYGTIHTHRMLIIDGKTLFGEVSPAEDNDQMRELVALARFNYPACESFTAAILQPWVTHRPSIAHYDAAEAELALRLLRLSIADAADPDAPRTPGAWCKHCPALGNCEEARSHLRLTYDLSKRIEKGDFALPIGVDGARMLDAIETAEITLKALKASYKTLIASDPDLVPGWYLKEGNKVREIEDIAKAYEIAKDYISLEAFLAATRLTIGPLKEAIGEATSQTGKALEDAFNQQFESVITLKVNAPVLTRESARKGRHKEIAND